MTTLKSMTPAPVVVGTGALSVDDVLAVAVGNTPVLISDDPAVSQRLERSRQYLEAALSRGEPVYGVTTGYGGSCGSRLEADTAEKLGHNLIQYHGCGSGPPLGIPEIRAAMLCRLVSLLQGYSGVSRGLLDQLVGFLNCGLTPVVPARGSVGASGDLTPLSYLAATLAGEREVFYRGQQMATPEALKKAGLEPYRYHPKEPLAIINGTAIMTGIAVLAIHRSRRILDAVTWGTALAVHGLAGNVYHYDHAIFQAKPHPGSIEVAARINRLLRSTSAPPSCDAPEALQDPYSVRCTPHVAGVLADSLEWIIRWVEIELNGVSDNPLLEPETGAVLTGGNFYGGHIAQAMDSLKCALASVADLADRQVALLVDSRFNRGLPSGLTGVKDHTRHLNHGFKALQITASALTAEALKNTMPASSFSRSTESHNQDKVSQGTIAARDADEITQLVARTVAVQLLAGVQACELRGAIESRPELSLLVDRVRALSKPLYEDRALDGDLERVAHAILDNPAWSSPS